MKRDLKYVFTLATFALLVAANVYAEAEERMVIALKTSDFELSETDISTLQVGESQTVQTRGGKTIDILRTTEGVEIYVDGELLDMDIATKTMHEEELHERHMMKKHVEIVCESDEECDESIFVLSDDADISSFVNEDGENIVIHKEIELTCTADDEETNCSDKMVWISDDQDIDLEALHEKHGDESNEPHRVIIVKKHVVVED